MARELLITATRLRSLLTSNAHLIIDCRFDLKDTQAGFAAYLESHIPGAVYAHLDNDLSSHVTDSSGRHPLPDADEFAAFLARIGWVPGTSIVAYDDADGSIAARLWWLMKYFGHDCGVLLDGGFKAWCEAGFELESGPSESTGSSAELLVADNRLVLTTAEVVDGLARREILLVDARARERFAGEIEPIDTLAGHIPDAVNYPFTLNLGPDGTFKPVAEIYAGLQAIRGQNQVQMCGSGVSACSNIFAAELAGLEPAKLYVGSWSEWIRDPSRPIAVFN